MITILTPENIAYALTEIQLNKRSKASIAREFGIRVHTLSKNLDDARMHGFKAFALKPLKSRVQPLCKGKSLTGAYESTVNAGLFSGTKESFRHALYYANIDYLKVG